MHVHASKTIDLKLIYTDNTYMHTQLEKEYTVYTTIIYNTCG